MCWNKLSLSCLLLSPHPSLLPITAEKAEGAVVDHHQADGVRAGTRVRARPCETVHSVAGFTLSLTLPELSSACPSPGLAAVAALFPCQQGRCGAGH